MAEDRTVEVTLQQLNKVRGLETNRVFLYKGRPLSRISRAFKTVLRQAIQPSGSPTQTLRLDKSEKGRGRHCYCNVNRWFTNLTACGSGTTQSRNGA
jgi:hypothetical protein